MARGRAIFNRLILHIVPDASRPEQCADEEYPLFVRREAPHNQRIEQMPFGHSSSAHYDS